MAYGNNHSNKSFETANKTGHISFFQDPEIQAFLARCELPVREQEAAILPRTFTPSPANVINNVIAIDGGLSVAPVKNCVSYTKKGAYYPDAAIAFMKIGAIQYSKADIAAVSKQKFVNVRDLKSVTSYEQFPLALPIKDILLEGCDNITDSFRQALFEFFTKYPKDSDLKFIDNLRWLLFEEYHTPQKVWHLSSCPHCGNGVDLKLAKIENYSLGCPYCGKKIFLTDVLRLHESIDPFLGAGGVVTNTLTSLEQLEMVYLMRFMLENNPAQFFNTLYLKDGPLAFFGPTANMHAPMRNLITYLHENHNIFMAGVEKESPFTEYANQIKRSMEKGQALLLGNDYIYRKIAPRYRDNDDPYGNTSYYSNKLIYKAKDENIYVVSIPNLEPKKEPSAADYINIDAVLCELDNLFCNLYENALLPIVLVNEVSSVSQYPGSALLSSFAGKIIRGKVQRNTESS